MAHALSAMAIAVEADPKLPGLAYALDADAMEIELRRAIRPFVPADAWIGSVASEVIAYKPGRRCVIAYSVEVRRGRAGSRFGVVGKLRARKNGEHAYELLRDVWNAGFAADSRDGISVPEPIGVVGACGMWVQRRVDAATLTAVLGTPDAISLSERIADAVEKLHRAGVPATHRHTIEDELNILDRCLREVVTEIPEEAARLVALADLCHRIGAMLPEPAWCPSHRDFYGDQVLVDGQQRLFLIDFDLYCEADPGLDVGNFLGHVTEHALRHAGDPRALGRVETALARRFEQLAGPTAAFASRTYAALTIARHVYLSRRIAGRHHTTSALVALAEQRARMVAADGGHA